MNYEAFDSRSPKEGGKINTVQIRESEMEKKKREPKLIFWEDKMQKPTDKIEDK